MTYVVSAVIVLGLLIIVHEFGHFWMARRMGVGVEVFSIGFGKKIWSRKVGETEYAVSVAPLGGYVKMVGDELDEPCEKPELAFNNKPVWRRLLIVAAGPTANLLFAVFLFALVYMIGVNMPDTKIKEVMEGSPAQSVGLEGGDRIVEIDGVKIDEWGQIADLIGKSPGERVLLKVEKSNGRTAEIDITPEAHTAETIFGEEVSVGRIGISPDEKFQRYNPLTSLYLGFKKTWEITYLTGMVIVKIFQNVVPANTIGGPLMIFKIAGDQAQAGIVPLIMFMGVLSVNLGILNFLPVPVLDGGHIVFFIIEGIKGSPVSMKGREIAQQVGIFLLISLMLFAFYNDITRFLTGGE